MLATKGRFPMGSGPNDAGLSTRHLARALDASLGRLGVDAVDLYQVHAWDPHTPLEETLRTLDGFVRAGKIHYYGLSNFTGWQLTKAVHTARALGLREPVTLQPQYSLIVREIEWEDGLYQVKGQTSDGRPVKLYVDGNNGNVLSIRARN